MSVRKAARAFGVSHEHVYQALHVLADSPELVPEIEAGRLAINAACARRRRITISFPIAVFDRLQELRNATGLSVADQVRLAVEKFLGNETDAAQTTNDTRPS
jgi:hypothetical protein